MSKRFSVRKAESTAIKAATKVLDIIQGSNNGQEFLASFLSENTKMTWFRAVQMIKGLGRLKTPFDALRAGFAIQSYPECFTSEDNELDPPYLGDPVFPVHGRVLDCCVSNVRGREIILMKFLAMNSIFAGRLYKLSCSPYVLDKLLHKVYSGKDIAPYVAISGCYVWLNSDLLFREILKRDVQEAVGVNTEERSINKGLFKDRGFVDDVRSCSTPKGVSCYACKTPRSVCRLSTREKEVPENDVQGEDGGDVSVSG